MTITPTDADLLVVGGGNAGAALALAAAEGGLTVILLDATPVARRTAPDFDGRAYALAAASVKALRALGVWESVAPRAQAMREIRISDGRLGDPGPVRLRFEGAELDRAPFAWLLEDRWLRSALLEAVAAHANIEHRSPARLADHRADGARVRATLEEGGEISARLIAACDGKRSAVAARAGLRRSGRRYGQTGLVCAVRHDAPHEGVARQIFYPGGPFAILPLPGEDGAGDVSSLVWSEREPVAARIAALDDAAYLAEVERRMGGLLGPVALVGRRWAYPLELSLAYAYVGDRVAAVGDAAHAVHPIAGQGFNLALRDVAALAETLAEARRRGEDVGAAGVLRRYERWRRFDSTGLAAATDGLNRLFSTGFTPLRALRDAGLACVDAAPGLKRSFMTAAAGLSGDAPRMLRGEAP